jgi:hypothetical protein
MSTPQRVWHYVKPNETTRLPRRHVFLDTEPYTSIVDGGHEQRWALAVACFRVARPDRKPHEHWSTWDDPEIMWKEVSEWCGASGRTVLWTHNLGYDSRIAEMFTELPRQGWRLEAHNLTNHGTWLVWRRNRATLTMVDSASVFPTTLAQVGKTFGLGKRPLPGPGSGGVGLYSRCWQDVVILRQAVVSYLEWLESEDLGNWQLTGAGQSWAAFRHRFMDRRLLVHDDPEALAAERKAMWTGRCEAYWHGEINFQVVDEWDFSLAHARVARAVAVPVRFLGPMPEGYDWMAALRSQSTAILAEVVVTVGVPVVPTMDNGRIVWPVGTFTTTLWDVEISEALSVGASVTLVRGWLYHKAPALKKWADWVISNLESVVDSDGDWRYTVWKHWVRALPGRFAMTHRTWTEVATTPEPAARTFQLWDATTGKTTTAVHIGQTLWEDAGSVEWANSMPMVTGYIQAVCRVWYWRLYREAPPNAVLYGDTDSVLTTDRHRVAMQAVADAHPEWGLRLKRVWQGFAVWGPRQIRTGQRLRVAGLKSSAERTGPAEYIYEAWETLEGALAKGHPGAVVVRDRRWTIKGTDHRRVGPALGWTEPVRLPRPAPSERQRQEETHDGQARRPPGQAERRWSLPRPAPPGGPPAEPAGRHPAGAPEVVGQASTAARARPGVT